jgi:hypothetical protein
MFAGNLIADTCAGLNITGVGSEIPFSLDPLYN